jgi:palmitoyltransferase ZDHHC9/14/18
MSMSGSQQRAEIPPKRIHPNANPSENGHEPVAKQQQNYQVFPGRNHFFCRGRLMTSRAYWAFLVALLFLSVPSALFLAFT